MAFPECATCGDVFAARVGGRGYKRATCSDVCAQELHRCRQRERHATGSPEYRMARKESKARRRAAEYGAESERFSHREVFERDGWVCGICEGPVDPELEHPDPMSASLDHVTPLSRGGQHTMDNSRCSHLVCNQRRGNRDVAA